MRFAGTTAMRSSLAASTLTPFFLAAASKFCRRRSVSNTPGSRKLMVTFEAATERATPARNACRPARAPDDRSRPNSGIFTEPDVMLTMRPKRFATMGSMAFWMSSIATTMLAVTPSMSCSRVSSRKSRKGGPALLLTRMSGRGQAANRAAWPCGVATSAVTARTVAPVLSRNSLAVISRRLTSRPLTTTSQPACASAIAQARPRPRLEAHTMALRPAIPRSMGTIRMLVGGGGDWRLYTFAPAPCPYVARQRADQLGAATALGVPLPGGAGRRYRPGHAITVRSPAADRRRCGCRRAAVGGRCLAHAAAHLARARCAHRWARISQGGDAAAHGLLQVPRRLQQALLHPAG